jgi:hypothetical protein
MITGFDETKELTDDEMGLVPIIVKRFNDKKGKVHIVTNEQIRKGLKANLDIDITEPRVRKIIQYIRVKNLLIGLIATSKGYFLATDSAEVEAWLSTMEQRKRAIEETIRSGRDDLDLMKSKGL